MTMRYIGHIILSIAAMWAIATPTGSAGERSERWLATLDSVLTAAPQYAREKEARLDALKARVRKGDSGLNREIFMEYSTFSVDSALEYAARLDVTAERKIKRSFVLAAGGLLKEAMEAISGVRPDSLPRELRKEYYSQMMYIYNHLGDYSRMPALSREYYRRGKAYGDTLTALLHPADRDYPLYTGWNSLGGDSIMRGKVIGNLTNMVSRSPLNTRDDGRDAYVLAQLLKAQGDREGYIACLAMAAVADVRGVNRDIASLEDLAAEMLDRGETERAYTYSSYALNSAILYPNRIRTAALAPLHDRISKAYSEKSRRQERVTRWLLALASMLLLVLIGAVLIIFRQIKKIRKSGRELAEANLVKEKYLASLFSMNSGYIKRFEDFRKNINRKSKARQFDEIRRMTETSRESRAEVREFYRNFDGIFLQIFPDFVREFNALLRPGEEVVLREGELLNTELRIYALARLGITDSVRIAELLHCSPQTVYNYRHGLRNRSRGGKEAFESAAATIGKVTF